MQNLETKEKQPFEITDMSSLTWVMREILSPLKAKVEQTKMLEKAEIDRIKAWAENENRSPLNDIEYWEQRIADYHLKLLRTDPKQKTLSTPYGKSSSRRSPTSIVKGDEDYLMDYVKENGYSNFIKVERKESVDWKGLKEKLSVAGNHVVDGNGQIVEGAVVKPETVTTKVELL